MPKASAESLSVRFHKDLGYWPNIEAPRTVQEKLLWRMLHEDMTEAVRLADKVAVRDYVRDVVGEKYLVEAYAITDSVDDLDFDALPESFVLKVNRASGTNLFVRGKSVLDVPAMRRLLNHLLNLKYGSRQGEHWYAAITPRILVERLLIEPDADLPVDYRFHVFHGKAEFIQVVTGKVYAADLYPLVPAVGQTYVNKKTAVHTLYDLNWEPAPFQFRTGPQPPPSLERLPGGATEMVEVAERLAGDWGYVRVDLYCIGDKDVYFSEMTFAPSAGLFGLTPPSYNEFFGALWDINRRYVRTERALNPPRGSQGS